jgi:hypothetical protein
VAESWVSTVVAAFSRSPGYGFGMDREEPAICPECNEPAIIRYAQLAAEEDGNLIEQLAGVECRTEGCTNFVAPPRIG